MSFFHRIRTRLAFAFVLIAIIPALIVGIYSVRVSSDTLLERAYDAQARDVASLKQTIKGFLNSARGDVRFLSRSQPLSKLIRLREQGASKDDIDAARKELEQEFLAFSMERKIYYQVRYLDETGQEVARIDSNGSDYRIRPQAKMQNKAGRYYFSDAVILPAGQVFVSPLDLNREHGKVEVPHKPVIRYAVPLKFSDGRPAGIVLTNVDANQFLRTVGDKILVDENGYYLAHPQADKAWGSDRDLGTGYNLHKDYPGLAEKILTSDSGTLRTATSVLTFKAIRIPGTNRRWVAISARNLDDVLASVVEFRRTFAAILGGALLFALILALVLDRRITRPIEYLTEQANRVSMGDLLTPITVKDRGEIGQLAAAFERMRVSMVKALQRRRRKTQS